jgi:hypothetical protein
MSFWRLYGLFTVYNKPPEVPCMPCVSNDPSNPQAALREALTRICPCSQYRMARFIAVCSCLYQATVCLHHCCDTQTDLVWYTDVQTGLGTFHA